MGRITVKITDNAQRWKKIRHELHKLAQRSIVAVGIQGEQATQDRGGISGAQLAATHEFGATIQHPGSSNGFGRGIAIPPHKIRVPERSFLRSTVDENRSNYGNLSKDLIGQIVDGKITVDRALGIFGEKVVGDVKAKISAGIQPPNAASTVRRKGSAKPLIDSGQLRGSITYRIKAKGEGKE